MKDNIEIGYLSKFDASRSNRDQVTDFKTQLKIHANLSNFERLPKPYELLKFFAISVTFIKIGK